MKTFLTATLNNTVQAIPGETRLTEYIPISFPYVSKSDIHVFVGGVETNNYEWKTASSIELKETFQVTELPVSIRVERVTTVDLPEFYPGSSIRAEDLNTSFETIKLRLEELSQP